MDPASKQMLIFSFALSSILSFFINFFLVELLRGSFLYGFPVSLTDSIGLGSFFARIINTLVVSLILLPAVYYGVKYMQSRVRI